MIINRLAQFLFGTITILIVSACSDSISSPYKEIGWEDLRPNEEKELDQTKYYNSLEISEDWYTNEEVQSERGLYSGAPPQALSVGVVSKFDGKSIRVPGYVVPIEFESDKLVSEFFLVPYFGACFHKPPPPPNQIIYVSSTEPFEYESIYDPVWVMGVIKTEQIGNDIATSSYVMDLHQLEPYEE